MTQTFPELEALLKKKSPIIDRGDTTDQPVFAAVWDDTYEKAVVAGATIARRRPRARTRTDASSSPSAPAEDTTTPAEGNNPSTVTIERLTPAQHAL